MEESGVSYLRELEQNIYLVLAANATLKTAFRMSVDGVLRDRNTPQGLGPKNQGNSPYLTVAVTGCDRELLGAGIDTLNATVEIEAVAVKSQRDPFLVAAAIIKALKSEENFRLPGVVVNDWRHSTRVDDDDKTTTILTTLSVRLIVPEGEE